VNCLRTIPAIGNVVWGARTPAAAPLREVAPYRLKLIVTVMTTGTATPFKSVGAYSH